MIVLLCLPCCEQVPFGPLAFMPGKLVHTNEVTALLGDNWFAKCSTKQAQKIVARRMKCESVHSSKAFVSFHYHGSAVLRRVQQRALLHNSRSNHWREGTRFLVAAPLFAMWIWENLFFFFLRRLKNLVHFQEMFSEVKCFFDYARRNVSAQNFPEVNGFHAATRHDTFATFTHFAALGFVVTVS